MASHWSFAALNDAQREHVQPQTTQQPIAVFDLTDDLPVMAPATSNPSKKRKVEGQRVSPQNGRALASQSQPGPSRSTTQHSTNLYAPSDGSSTKKRKKQIDESQKTEVKEKRARMFRKKAPISFLEIRTRALTQRMFVVRRQRFESNTLHPPHHPIPTEKVEMVGTTGNKYSVTIDSVPRCTCPHNLQGHQCKHILYVLIRVLRAPEHLQYQLAFLAPELTEIFQNAPPIAIEHTPRAEVGDIDRRRPIEDDCPICFDELDPNAKEQIVWCESSCGNNVHRDCLRRWAASKREDEERVTCPLCRAPWKGEGGGCAGEEGRVTQEGYVNVAEEYGLNPNRNYSGYNEFWVRKRGRGRRGWSGW